MKTLKTLAVLCLSALLFSGCEPSGNTNTDKSGLILTANKTFIYDNGGADENGIAVFTLTYNGEVVTEGYTIYEGMDTPLEGNTFTSTEKDVTHKFWAAYGTEISSTISVTVIATPPPAPAAPVDNNPSKTNFVRRVLLTQFTGTNCGFCPNMMNALYQFSTSENSDKAVIAAAHLYNESDPAYVQDAANLQVSMGIIGFPSLVADLNPKAKGNPDYASVLNLVNKAQNRVAVKGGIAVNSKYYQDEEYIVINATVKAKTTGEFRIGAWLLEDNIYANQANNGISPVAGLENFNTHNNCVRLANSKYSESDFSGYTLGTIKAGETASMELAFELKKNGTGSKNYWNHDNLRVIVFISTKEGNSWLVNNVVKVPKDGSVDFEYEN